MVAMNGLAVMWLWSCGCWWEVWSCCWKEIGCRVVKPPPMLFMTGTLCGCVDAKPMKHQAQTWRSEIFPLILTKWRHVNQLYQWGEKTLLDSWRLELRPWWGSVRVQGRWTDCAERSECLLGAVGHCWTPATSEKRCCNRGNARWP